MHKFLFISLIYSLLSVLTYAQNANFMPMVYVQGGKFEMGGDDNQSEVTEADERPIHSVTLLDFWIGKYEVTVAQYRTYCNETGVSMPPIPIWGWNDNQPIVNVNWSNAKGFADWLSKKTGQQYDLPTEAQWEYAARGGNLSQNKVYAGSNNLGIVGWFGVNSVNEVHLVGQKQANELGIYDMSGNVWEWCRDWYGPYSTQSQHEPSGPDSGKYRVVRGGSARRNSQGCRVAYRNFHSPDFHYSSNGFRVVLKTH